MTDIAAMTDRQLCDLARRHAHARGENLKAFLMPVTCYGVSALSAVERGGRFGVERRAALVKLLSRMPPVEMTASPPPRRREYAERLPPAFRPPQPTGDYSSIRAARMAASLSYAEAEKNRIERLRDSVPDRSPCPWCAVRADVGCGHRRPASNGNREARL